jgi:hypothetical protein
VIGTLIKKELREHFWVIAAAWLFFAMALIGLLKSADDSGSPLGAYRQLVLLSTLMSLVLANRLVVREYGGRTQLFLETLPIGRAHVIAVKWLLGAACLLVPLALGLAVTLWVSTDTVDITQRFIMLLGLRGGTFALFFYSLAFCIALMGRYRYVLWLALIVAIAVIDSFGQNPVEQWAPLQLVSDTLPFERDRVPVQELWVTWIATMASIAVMFTLTLAFNGSWVVSLSRSMSLKEKTIVTAMFLATVSVIVQLEERKPKPPFEVHDAVVSDDAGENVLRVSVARADNVSDDRALELARILAADVYAADEFLSLESIPKLAVLPDSSIDSDLFLLAELPNSDGVVVRGAVGSEHFDLAGFRAFVVSSVIDWHSRGRAMREERRWLADGFAQWLVARHDPIRRERLALRASAAMGIANAQQFSLDDSLHRWLTVREQLGDCLSDALAWRAAASLANEIGEVRFRDLMQASFGTRPHADVRALLAERSTDELLRRANAPSVTALSSSLLAAPLVIGEFALWPVNFRAAPMRGSTFEVRYDVAFGRDQVAQPFAVRYFRIGPWEREITRARMSRVDATASGVLPNSFTRGTRLFTAVEVNNSKLNCTVRYGAHRWEVR